MEILTKDLPSGGYGYKFSSISINPMSFLEVCKYLENQPPDSLPLERYLYDIRVLLTEDPNILDCYVMDLDFLIFYKKLCTISGELTYEITVKCPHCGKDLKKVISFERDIHFKQIEPGVMKGAYIELGGHKYETMVPTVRDFQAIFDLYLRFKKVTDLKMIKTIALIKNFELQGNQIESDVLGATHNDITLLLALRELYYDRLEPVKVYCPECNKGVKKEERRSVAVGVDSIIVDFFRDIVINNPIDGRKVLFK